MATKTVSVGKAILTFDEDEKTRSVGKYIFTSPEAPAPTGAVPQLALTGVGL